VSRRRPEEAAVPTANSAVQAQPIINNNHARRGRFALHAFGVLLGLALLIPAATIASPSVEASASPACNGWNSTSQPPDRIRVFRVRTGRIDSVAFRQYVTTVLGKEWPAYLPVPVVQAGAVAVKQYAWFHALTPRRTKDGRCYDVKDSTGDQLYKPGKARIRSDHHRAVDVTWGVRLEKNGRLFMTGYRRGNKGACGSDATGWKLFARSATRCADNGKGYLEILRIYYGPGLNIKSAGGSAGTVVNSASSASAVAPTTAPTTSIDVTFAGFGG
jgi:hypothetical protein